MFDWFKQQWDAALAQYQTALSQLDESEAKLWAISDDAHKWEDTAAEWDTQNKQIIAMRSTLESVQAAVNQIAEWWNQVSSATGLSGIKTLRGLGILPAIPWATLAIITGFAAAVLIIYKSVNALDTNVRLRALATLNEQRAATGLAPLAPADVGITSGNSSLIGDTTGLIKWLAIGAAIIMILGPALKHGK